MVIRTTPLGSDLGRGMVGAQKMAAVGSCIFAIMNQKLLFPLCPGYLPAPLHCCRQLHVYCTLTCMQIKSSILEHMGKWQRGRNEKRTPRNETGPFPKDSGNYLLPLWVRELWRTGENWVGHLGSSFQILMARIHKTRNIGGHTLIRVEWGKC